MDIVDELQATELNELQIEELDLESLIRDGINTKVPIIVTLPDGRKGKALIRPLTSTEWSNCVKKFLKFKEGLEFEICKKGLLTTNEEPFPKEALEQLPAGTVIEIFMEIKKITGIQDDKEAEEKFTKQIFDF